MKKTLLALVAIVIVGGGLAYLTGIIKFGATAGICQTDEEITQDDRASVDDVALAFVRATLANPADAYGLMTKDAQANLDPGTFTTSTKQFFAMAGPKGDVSVAHTFFIRDTSNGPETRIVCGKRDHYQWTALAIKPGHTQAHVALAGHAANNDLAFNVWLLQEDGHWRVQYFHLGVSSIAGHSPESLLTGARAERDSGHMFNAAILYAGVRGTIDRGLAVQAGIQQEVGQDLIKFPMPPDLKGPPPFHWTMQSQTFTVALASIIGINGKLGLIFVLPQTAWNGDDDADKKNKAFINAFIATHPDYQRDFSFLIARAYKPDNTGGFGTLYQNGKGFG